MNRRGFVKLLAGAIAGVAISTNIPLKGAEYLPEWLRQESVCAYLQKQWNLHTKGTGFKQCPNWILVGRKLFEGFEAEINVFQRFVSTEDVEKYRGLPNLVFKTARMQQTDELGDWEFRFERR